MYAIFCNSLPILVDIGTKSSLQPKHWFFLLVYSLIKPAENPSMDKYEHPVSALPICLFSKRLYEESLYDTDTAEKKLNAFVEAYSHLVIRA